MITAEMVEKAYEIWLSHVDAKKSLRAALEAVAPMLVAQGMREAAELLKVPVSQEEVRILPSERILARAQELDPQ